MTPLSVSFAQAHAGVQGKLLIGAEIVPASAVRCGELALRAASDRFRGRVSAASDLAASEGRSWNDLGTHEQLALYARVRLSEGD